MSTIVGEAWRRFIVNWDMHKCVTYSFVIVHFGTCRKCHTNYNCANDNNGITRWWIIYSDNVLKSLPRWRQWTTRYSGMVEPITQFLLVFIQWCASSTLCGHNFRHKVACVCSSLFGHAKILFLKSQWQRQNIVTFAWWPQYKNSSHSWRLTRTRAQIPPRQMEINFLHEYACVRSSA